MANTPISDFPAASSVNASDVLAGVQDGVTKKFSFAIVLNWLKQQLDSLFVPTSREINGKPLNVDITLDASDVGAVDTADVGVADGVASLDSTGKVPSSQLPPISSDASDITYDPTTSGLTATNVQDAIDEVYGDIPTQPSDIGAQDTITASGILKGDGAGGVSAAVSGTDYQAPLTFDNTPTASSNNPVKSGGVYTDVRTRVPNYGKGQNLLRNWYFVGGGTGRGVFPVNSRNVTTISTGSTSFIDGWETRGARSGSVSLGANNLSITTPSGAAARFGILQYVNLNEYVGKAITFSVLTPDGCYSRTITSLPISSTAASVIGFATADGGSAALVTATSGCFVQITSVIGGTSLYNAIKLELGTEQTLCHNEGTAESPVWVLNEVPDYEYELFRCMTSTADSTDTYANKTLANEQELAYVESGNTASRAYAVGEYFCWNGLLYRVTSPISSGGTFTPGTNCEQVTVGAELTAIDRKMYQVKYEANGTYTYTLPAGRWFLIYANRANTSSAGLYAVHITSSNGYLTTIFETSNFSNLMVLTISGRTLSIQVKDRYATLNILNFGGV